MNPRLRYDALTQLVNQFMSSGMVPHPAWVAELQVLETQLFQQMPPMPATMPTVAIPAAALPPIPPTPTMNEPPRAFRPQAGDRIPIIIDEDNPEMMIRSVLRVWGLRHTVYNSGGQLVELQNAALTGKTIFSFGEPVPPRAIPLNAIRAWTLAGRECRFATMKNTKQGPQITPCMPPMWLGTALISRSDYEDIPVLEGMIHAPTVRSDGALMWERGYDASTQVYITKELPLRMPERPTQMDAQIALQRLLDIICDFDFALPAGRTSWVASVLSLAARHTFDGPVPIFIFDATRPGAGKTLLVDLANIIATGASADRMIFMRDAIEMDKRITALALASETSALLDNVQGKLKSAPLDAAVTGTFYKSRILGKSEMPVKLPIKIVWFVTGNGIVVSTDIARRSLITRLTPDSEKPYQRNGPTPGQRWRYPNILNYVKQNRAELLGYALTIVQAYIQAGRPSMGVESLGSFEAWSDTIRSAILFAGGADPCGTSVEIEDSDLDDLAVRRVVACWPGGEDMSLTVGELLEWATIEAPLSADLRTRELFDATRATRELWREALCEWIPPKRNGDLPLAKELGYALRSLKDSVIGSFKIVAGRHTKRGIPWRRVRVDSAFASSLL